MASAILFLIFYYTRENPISNVLSILPGIYVFILTPGSVFSSLYPSKGLGSLPYTVITGLLFNSILIHVLFYVNLITAFVIPLATWLLAFNVTLVAIVSVLTWSKKLDLRRGPWFSQPDEKCLAVLLLLALAIRIILAMISANSIAADASLYSDYARSIINGEFHSNVIGDPTVYEMANGIQYSVHQGFIYLSSISFLLFSPFLSGPTVILIILGLCLILFCYEITSQFFGNKSALWVAGVISVHPLFVFHSVVAFGPELSSLVFLMGGISIIVQGDEASPFQWLLAGMLIGFADVIWTPNFLFFSAAFPILAYMIRNMTTSMRVTLSIGTVIMSIVRIFYWDLQFPFIFIWIIWTGFTLIIHKRRRTFMGVPLLFTWGILGIIVFWRALVHVAPIVSGLSRATPRDTLVLLQIPSIPLNIFNMGISNSIIIGVLLFFVTHSTPIILVLSIISLVRGYNKSAIFGFWLMCIVGLVGTTIVLNALGNTKDVLLPAYFYSDSRFFISLVLLMVMASGGMFRRVPKIWTIKGSVGKARGRLIIGQGKVGCIVVLVLLASLLPNYAQIPSGLELNNFESRFGWVNLGPVIRETTDENAVFVVDRCTEFSWLTARRTVKPWIPVSLPLFGALSSLGARASEFNASYFVLDGYTVAYYKTFDTTLQFPLTVGGAIPLSPQEINYTLNRVETSSLILQYQTPSNKHGDYARLYRFKLANFSRISMIDLLDDGWGVGNGGLLKNESGQPQIVVGKQENYTFTWHNGDYNLNLTTTSGFIAMKFQEGSACVSRVEFYDTSGNFVGYGSNMKKGRYYFFTGDSSIGDIRIVVTGPPGSYVTVNDLSLWAQSL